MPETGTPPIPIEDARNQLLANIYAVEAVETLAIEASVGRIAAENVVSQIDLRSNQFPNTPFLFNSQT